MDHDGIRRANLVERGSRRTALRAGASGLAAAFGFGALGRVAAQEATPTGAQPTELLFVQSFGAGTLARTTGQTAPTR